MSGQILAGFPSQSDLLVKNKMGVPVRSQDGKTLYADARSQRYRDWFSSRVSAFLRGSPLDGIALDVVVRTPRRLHAKQCATIRDFCPEYAKGMDDLLARVKRQIGSKLLLFNGLFGLYPGELKDQLRLLRHADAAAIEYFGLFPEGGNVKPFPFREGVLPYLNLAREFPGKLILFFARGPYIYTDYLEDYDWQRYLYACYLLGAGPNTNFKYLASFSQPAHAGRAGALDVYEDWEIRFGKPLGPYESDSGVYLRRFSNGLVLVAPNDASPKTYELAHKFYSPEGRSYSGKVVLHPGQGLLLLASPPPAPAPREINLRLLARDLHSGISLVGDPTGKKQFLRFQRLPDNLAWMHDVLLDFVRSRIRRPILRMRVRTIDAKAKLLLVAEVDDKERRASELALTIPFGQPREIESQSAMDFRVSGGARRLPCFAARESLRNTGNWQNLDVDGREISAVGDGSYTFRRWVYARVIGALDISSIEIGRR